MTSVVCLQLLHDQCPVFMCLQLLHVTYVMCLQLLHDQVGVVQFEAYKQHFVSTFTRARAVYTALPSLPPLFGHPHRNW